jgi:hypothetical protein
MPTGYSGARTSRRAFNRSLIAREIVMHDASKVIMNNAAEGRVIAISAPRSGLDSQWCIVFPRVVRVPRLVR